MLSPSLLSLYFLHFSLSNSSNLLAKFGCFSGESFCFSSQISQVISLIFTLVDFLSSFVTMVLIRECDGEGRVIPPANSTERDQFKRDCLRHATRSNGVIDWDAYELALHGEDLFIALSSDSDSISSSDSDCVFLYAKSGTDLKREFGQEICLFTPPPLERQEESFLGFELEMESFAEEITSVNSLYVEDDLVNFFRSERDISSTGHEEDVEVMCCDEGEHVAIQHPVDEEVFYMHAAILEDFGVQLPLNAFEADVLKFLHVAPSQIRPNNWAFIRGFEILCKALGLEPSLKVRKTQEGGVGLC